ncbi:MAG: DNA-protecting protein DprA [Cyanobacteria bacterium QS_8_64_29]|nr:MAG: DNA-protecting protein DprA [Cyanobacteria bacterium QS_8_64_29]
MVQERAYWLAWSQVPGMGAVSLQRLWQHFGTLSAAWAAPAGQLKTVEGMGERTVAAALEARLRLDPPALLAQHRQHNPHFWTPEDGAYPRLLREIPSPPPLLYYAGQPQPEASAAVDIVGTRSPSEYGRRWTRQLSAALARHGITVISGLAAGIDAEAHRGCLAAGGRTIAVFGTGLDRVYPANHRSLAHQIRDRGLLLSEYPAGTPPEKGNFPARNRIIAGLARAVLVTEAPPQSGALITARQANEFGRDVYALPGSLDSEPSLGCLDLLNQGAYAVLGESHLLELLGTMPQLDAPSASPAPQAPPADLDPTAAQVLDAVAGEPTPFDAIVSATGLSANAVSSALLQLELKGLVAQQPGQRYQRQ